MKNPGVINFTYFSETGKFCATGIWEPTEDAFREISNGMYTPRSLGEHMREFRLLPGLSRGTWEGPFVIDCGYQELVLPEVNA